MTREEAINILNNLKPTNTKSSFDAYVVGKAITMAIKALKQEPKTGYWKRISIDKYSEHAKYWYRCDRCGKDNLGNTDWCPNCGAKMESEEV